MDCRLQRIIRITAGKLNNNVRCAMQQVRLEHWFWKPESRPIKSMTVQVYLAMDLGAESGRVMAGLWDGDQMRLEQIHRFPNGPVEVGDSLHWDVARLWLEIQNGFAAAARQYGRKVVSAGVDIWGVDFVLLSKNSEMLGLPHHYRDRRTRGM